MSRLFVAVWPSPPIVEQLRVIPRPDEPGVRWTAVEKLHVTLRFLGSAEPDEVVARLRAADLPTATAVYGPAVERLNPRLLVVPVAGLESLADTVRDATDGVGEDDRRRFRGHVTIARTRPGSRSAALGAAVAGEQDVIEIALVETRQDSTGSTYRTVATFAAE